MFYALLSTVCEGSHHKVQKVTVPVHNPIDANPNCGAKRSQKQDLQEVLTSYGRTQHSVSGDMTVFSRTSESGHKCLGEC